MIIETPAELAPALRRADLDTLPTIAQTISSPEFQEWWWVCAPSSRDADLEHIRTWGARLDDTPASDDEAALAEKHPDLPARLRCYALLSYFCPSLAFPFADDWIDGPAQFVERTRATGDRAHGIRLMRAGWLRLWLANQGVTETAITHDLSDEARFQHLSELLAPDQKPPEPQCDTTRLHFGRISPAQPKTQTVEVKQSGTGHLYGGVTLADADRGVTVEPTDIDGAPVTFSVRVDTTGMTPGSRQNTSLTVHTNGGELTVEIAFRVRRLWRSSERGDPAESNRPNTRLLVLLVIAGVLGAYLFAHQSFPGAFAYLDFDAHALAVPLSSSARASHRIINSAWTPSKIKQYLDEQHPNWQLAQVSWSTRSDCGLLGGSLDRPLSALAGDFDGDGFTDFAYELIADGRLLFIAFVGKNAVHVLNSRSADAWIIPLFLTKKGTSDYDWESDARVHFPRDAVTLAYCGKGAHTYLYSQSKKEFQKLITAD